MSSVPREFTGMARALIHKVRAEDRIIQSRLDGIEGKIVARLTRKPTLRPEHVMEVERLWKAMPATYRLAGPTCERPKKRMCIREVRLNSGTTNCEDWRDGEPNLSVSWVRLEVTADGSYFIRHMPMIAFGLHALGRRFQRGRDRSEAAVLADIAPLVALHDYMTAGGDPSRIEVPGGVWLGEVGEVELMQAGKVIDKKHALSVRTFLDHDTLEQVDLQQVYVGK